MTLYGLALVLIVVGIFLAIAHYAIAGTLIVGGIVLALVAAFVGGRLR